MADPIVQIEGVGNVQFPASMSEADISEAAHHLYTQAGARQIAANPPGVQRPAAPGMQMSNLGTAMNPTQSVAGPGEASYVAEADPESQARMLGAAAIGAGGTSGVITAAAKKVAPLAATAAASYAINEAKKLPVIGPVISKIPMVEFIPWLLPLTGKAGKVGKAAEEAEAVSPRTSGAAMDAAAEMRQKLGMSQFPPPAPVYRAAPLVNASNRAADVLETRGIQESMRNNLERTGAAAESEFLKNQAARNTTGETKGSLIEDANVRLGKRAASAKPVEYTQTPGVTPLKPGEYPDIKRATRAAPKKSVQGAKVQTTEDLVKLLEDSVRQANLRKAAGAKR